MLIFGEISLQVEAETLLTGCNVKILCLDDELNVVKSLARLFKQHNIDAHVYTSPKEALDAVKQEDFQVVISDMRMPEMDGASFLKLVREVKPDTQRVLLTGYSDLASTVKAINESGIHAYIQKPWDNALLLHTVKECSEKYNLKQHNIRLNTQLKEKNEELQHLNNNLEELVQKRTAQIRKVLSQLEQANNKEQKEHKATVELLYNFINANPYLDGKKAKNVAQLCRILCKNIQANQQTLSTVMMAGYLAEVGLLAMDPELYKVSPRRLTDEQKKIYYTHPTIAQLMLMPAQHLSDVSEAIYHQFEKYNGQGIPKGIKQDEIPLGSQILSVARDYYNNLENAVGDEKEKIETAIDLIKAYRGSFYSPKVVDALETAVNNKELGSEQVGSIDILTTEKLEVGMKLGLALHSNQGILLLPKGHIFTEKSINKLKQLESQRPIPFRIMVAK